MKPIAVPTFPVPAWLPAGLLLTGTVFWKNTQPSVPTPQPAGTHAVTLAADSSRLYLPNDLEATLWAESPMLFNPTNADVDERGRLWVTEAVNYRDFNNKPGTRLTRTGERVVILEDTDADGKADKQTVFVDDPELKSPLGIAVLGNRVVVSAAPNLIVYTDTNGDDKSDKKEILLTGFGGLDHDHSLHSVVAGPDGRWYFNVGNAGPHVVTDKSGFTVRSGSLYTGGTPYNKANQGNQKSDDGRVWTGGMQFAINPDGTGLKVLGHNFRNSYETAVDSYGNLWQNDNDDQVIACRTAWLMEGSNAGYFSRDGNRYWQADRRPGQDLFTAHWHQEDPGVLPVSDNAGAGSPTGVAVYEGDALGPKYRGMLLSAEAGRNVIYAYWPKPVGAGFELNRTNLISTLAQDNVNYQWNEETGADARKWFRPSDVLAGTDGALYVIDWYDPVVGGHAMQDKAGYGRIYRITPKGKKLTAPKLDLGTLAGQLDALQSPAVNVRNRGFVALRARGAEAVPAVAKLLDSENPYVRARAVYVLAQLGDAGLQVLRNAPLDGELKVAAFRAVRQARPELLGTLIAHVVQDPNPALRREVAIALRDVPLADARESLLKLVAGYDGTDRYYLTALGIGFDGKAEALYPELCKQAGEPAAWSPAMASLVWELHPKAAVADLKLRASSAKVPEAGRKQALTALAFIPEKTAAEAMVSLMKSPLKDVADGALWWVNFRRTNDWAEFIDFKEATAQLSPNHQRMMKLQFDVGSELPLDQRVKAAQEMAKDPTGGKMLVAMASEGRLSKELKGSVGELIFNNPDVSVRTMASDYFPRAGKQVSVDLIARMQADPAHGKTVFATYCASCHKHGAAGGEIGPNLTNIHQKFDRVALLDAIVNPSASLVFGYEPWIVTTKKGETLYGFVVSDGPVLVLRDAAGQQRSLKKEQIATRKQLPTSLMPDPVAMGLKEADLSDLVGYLLSFKQ
jgi:putative membrane-bound dehydrogenase-like protein